MSTLNEIKKRRNEILAIAGKYGIKDVRVFGSVARGEDRPDSDVDFLVNIEDGRSLYDFIRFRRETTNLLNKQVDVITEKGIYHLLRDVIINEAKPL